MKSTKKDSFYTKNSSETFLGDFRTLLSFLFIQQPEIEKKLSEVELKC